jgi:general secretion pathway protein A
MYEQFFGFKQPPFGVTTENYKLFFADTHREALARLVYGMLARKPLIILTGDVGLGKTTILRAALSRVTTHQAVRLVSLPHPLLRPADVLRLIGRALDMKNAPQLRVSDLDMVHQSMLEIVNKGERVVLVIDEAQSLPAETLEFVRLMSNLDAGIAGLFQIVLVGQPELWLTLQKFEFRHLRQRIAIRAEMRRLTSGESREYLRHRLQQAGTALEETFTPAAVKKLLSLGHGAPRRLNCIADNALLLAFGDGSKPVDARFVQLAAATQDKPNERFLRWRHSLRGKAGWLAIPAAVAAGAAITALLMGGPARKSTPATPTATAATAAQATSKPDPSATASIAPAAATVVTPATQRPADTAGTVHATPAPNNNGATPVPPQSAAAPAVTLVSSPACASAGNGTTDCNATTSIKSDATQSTAVFDNVASLQAPHSQKHNNKPRSTDRRAKPQATRAPTPLSSPGDTVTAQLSPAAPILHAATREGNSP